MIPDPEPDGSLLARPLASVRGRFLAALLGLAAIGCGPSLSAEPGWVQWFSYRRVFDMAAAPDGQTVLVGRSSSDETATSDIYGQSTWRPWIARVDADGRLLDDWTGYLGEIWGVAVDADARAYVIAVERGGTSSTCELRALEPDGRVRWSMPWDASASCPTEVVIAGDAVVVRHDDRLEAFELDGRLRWQQPVEAPNQGIGRFTAVGDSVWVAGTIPGLDLGDVPQALAWRYDARDGGHTQVDLELGPERFLGTFAASTDGLIVTSASGTRMFVASLTLDGQRRWEREIGGSPDPEDPSAWQGFTARPVADGDAAWIIGSEHRIDRSDPSRAYERLRMAMQRWSGTGEHEGTLRHAFADSGDEADPAVLARSACPASDVESLPVRGSIALDAVVRPDGGLLVAGGHGCRDAFLLRLEVER
jgi:hypothetical protein